MVKSIKLRVIPEPAPKTRTVFQMNDPEGKETTKTILFKGHENTNFICGNCESILAKKVSIDTIKNLVLKCNKCGSYNDATISKLPEHKAN
jgi:transcription elongation factor Elf1